MIAGEQLPDPVAAYDRIAPVYPRIAAHRHAYLRAIGDLVVAHIPAGSRSLLDVGAGDGTRAFHIAKQTGITEIVLLEPSAGMRRNAPATAEIWPQRAENVHSDRHFDVITCLWNVLGHIPSTEARIGVLAGLAGLLTPQGRMFLDVNHRYNLRSYGGFRTAARFVYDNLRPDDRHGDVTVSWNVGAEECSTYGHVFTGRELRRLAQAAGLQIEKSIVVDYQTGSVRRFAFEGNLFFVLSRAAVTPPAPAGR